MKEKILNLGNIIGAVCFTAVAVIFFFTPTGVANRLIGLITVAALGLVFIYSRKIRPLRYLGQITPERVYRLGAVIMLIIQAAQVAITEYIPITDASHLDIICRNFVNGNDNIYSGLDIYHQHYLERYSNQWGIFLLQSALYKASALLGGGIKRAVLMAVNILAFQLSYYLTYKTAQLVFKKEKQKTLAVLLMVMCPVMYAYTCVFYTDTLSMPFSMLTLYFAVRAIKETDRRRFLIFTLISAFSAAAGYSLKGSVAVIGVAAVIYMLFKSGIKRTAVYLTAFVIAFLSVNTAVSQIMYSTGAVTEEGVEEYGFPMTHWVMMGLKGRGGYNEEEFRYTFEISGQEEKKEANIEAIKNRLEDYGISGTLNHIYKKIQYTWEGGTYQSTKQFENSPDGIFKGFFSSSYIFMSACFAFQCVIILFMLFSFWGGALKKSTDEICLMRIAQLGIFLFLLIWETRSRYMLNVLPVYFLIACDGAESFGDFAEYLRGRFLKKGSTLREKKA